MQNSIDSKSDSIQLVYDNYVENKYLVNRRYQRKLVWEESEKTKFIDSIIKKYPVPLFLVAKISNASNVIQYEIIDGMQRLNAIFAFIENEIGVEVNGETQYFDLSILANTNQKLIIGKLKQKKPILNKQMCMDFLQYQLPFSYLTATIAEIDEVFRRINSFGRRLSEQEIRQAGAICSFSDIVRELASEIRGDISRQNTLTLNQMHSISLSNRKLKYGIDINDVFWVKNGIITQKNMRISRDEELIAYLVLHIVFGHTERSTTKTLDQLYHKANTDLYDRAENKILSMGKDTIKAKFNQTFSIIKAILCHNGDHYFNDLLFQNCKSEKISKVFQIIFIAIYELIYTDHLKVHSYSRLLNLLTNVGKNHLNNIKDHEWTPEFRKSMVNSIKGIIGPAFIKKIGTDAMYDDWTQEIDNIFQLSKVEGCQYDFKMGLHNLSSGNIDEKMIHKLLKILTSQVNKAPFTTGHIIIGIAETKESMLQFKRFYDIKGHISQIPDSDFFIVGLNSEITKYYNSADEFVRYVKSKINTAPLEDYIRQKIVMDIKLPRYHGKTLMILSLKSETEPILYDDAYYIREGNDTQEIRTLKESLEFAKRFSVMVEQCRI